MQERYLYQMKAKNKLLTLVITFFLVLNSSKLNASTYQWTYNNNSLIITEQVFKRLNDFLKGNFYSHTFKKQITLATPLYFAISHDGEGSVLSYCEDERFNCIASVAKYQTLTKCKKKFTQNCYILAIGNKIIINKKIYKVNNNSFETDLNGFLSLVKIVKKNTNNKEADIHYYSIREIGENDWGN